jgi:hypothetical protein
MNHGVEDMSRTVVAAGGVMNHAVVDMSLTAAVDTAAGEASTEAEGTAMVVEDN